MKGILNSAAKSAGISFTLGFVFVAGMISKAMKETAEEIIGSEQEVTENE